MGVVTASITSDGKTMDPTCEVLSIDIVREVNRIPYADLALIDGDVAQGKFAVSDGGFFDPGKKIAIKLRYEGDSVLSNRSSPAWWWRKVSKPEL